MNLVSVLVLAIILYISWRVGQPIVAVKERKKMEEIK